MNRDNVIKNCECNDLFFNVCNLPKFLEEQMEHIKEVNGSTMNKDNIEGYEYAVNTMLYIIKELISVAESENLILAHCSNISENVDIEEFDINEILKYREEISNDKSN